MLGLLLDDPSLPGLGFSFSQQGLDLRSGLGLEVGQRIMAFYWGS